jgi:hypothetical protein
MLEGADRGDRLVAHWYRLPLARIAKAYSVVLNWLSGVGPVPEGMSALSALKHDSYASRHSAIKSEVQKSMEQFQRQHGFAPPYWQLLRLARIAAEDSGKPGSKLIKN